MSARMDRRQLLLRAAYAGAATSLAGIVAACGRDLTSVVATPAPGTVDALAATAAPTTKAGGAPAVTLPARAAAQPGTLSGTILDARGRPLHTGTVTVTAESATGTVNTGRRVTITVTTGQYAQRVPDGYYTLRASIAIPYGGQKFNLPLASDRSPYGSGADSRPGLVTNFQWLLSGKQSFTTLADTEPSAYYGAALQVSETPPDNGTFLSNTYRNSNATFTLAPVGPLVDGSTGDTLTRTVPTYSPGYLLDIPLGTYTVSATLVEAGGARHPLRVGALDATGKAQYGPSATIGFLPETTGLGVGILPGRLSITA
ncbi:MAG: hypothetical protein LC793_00775 [Thermomicrobia bacterium]|nr:hypothetical protein [Thermomicrobia bacterium]MCA1724486.1 hypothetical protein [Thermomicrobia bacterium]